MDQTRARQTLRIDPAWRYHSGDIATPVPNKHISAYMLNKAGWARDAARPSFDDSDWRVLDLPHDWSVEGAFDPDNHVNQAFLPRGVGWYRRHFHLDESDRGKYIAIRFDGVATHCTVYVNGHLLHRNLCGYTPFTIDISDIANFGDSQVNTISVRVDATYMEGWWYEGAGIYRHVWLVKTSPVHVATDGVFVRPIKTSSESWDVHVETTIENRSDADVTCRLLSHIQEQPSPTMPEEADAVAVPARSSVVARQVIAVENPRTWSVDSPQLYRLETCLNIDGRVADDYVTSFGFRTIRFDPEQGFFLNDQPLKLQGTCNHQDHAGVGVAVPDSIQEFRIRRLKEMGCNAYRCAHNPPAPELLDACDRLGMLVMDENRNFGSSPEHLSQLEAMVKRDRNHPSVILWSICNEEALQGTPVGERIARTMAQHVRQLDPSRPVTAAVSGGILNDGFIGDAVDVMGINYQLATYDPFHAKHPARSLVAAETLCVYATRGIYQTNPERRVFASYDTEAAPWGATARTTWRQIIQRPFVAGGFAWTGFDYRGEPTPYHWPCISTHWGILDTCGFAKDSFFLHKAWWTREPFVHLLPHWTWPGREGSPIRVMTFTNCDEVELSLNGRSLGRKRVDPIEMAEWQVPYEPGQLVATGWRDGQVVARMSVRTTGNPFALGMEVHPSASILPPSSLPADGEFAAPITVFAVDEQGHRVPDANLLVSFQLDGPGRVIGVGNGDPNCHEPDKGSSRSLFNGLAQVIVQTATTPGSITLTASAPGMQSAQLTLEAAAAPQRPAVAPAKYRHFVNDWRMSPISSSRPDPNQEVSDTDMNSWERVQPAEGPQSAWSRGGGFAVYRATFTPPRSVQSEGGALVLHKVIGVGEVFVNGIRIAEKRDSAAASLRIEIPPRSEKVVVSVLVESKTAPAGLAGAVEIVSSY